MNRSLFALSLAAALLAATPKPSPSPSPSAAPSAGQPTTMTVGVWNVRASLMDISLKSGDFSTPDRVYMTRQGGDITADRASGNYKSKKATLYGNVIVHDMQGNFSAMSSGVPTQGHGPSTLTADQVQIDGLAKQYVATGHVHYVQADTTVDADKGTLNDQQHTLFLEGNVHIVQGDRSIGSDRVLYNTLTGIAHAEGNPVTLLFPSEVNPHIATPKPIHVPHNPLFHKETPTPSASAPPSPKP